MKTKQLIASIVLGLLVSASAPARADDVKDLIDKADMVFRGKTSAAVLAMEIKTSSFQRFYKIVSWDDSRAKDHSLLKILGPALWRGYGTLKVGEQLKLFNPKTNHVTVVSASMLGDSWMGSHLTNDDLVKETKLAEHYEYQLLKKWEGKSELGDGSTFYRVRLKPKPTAPVVWDRIVYEIIEKGKDVLPTRAQYYRKAKDATPTRTMIFKDVKKLGGRTVPATMKVTVAKKPGEYTRIVYKKLRFNVKIPKSKFTEQSLRK